MEPIVSARIVTIDPEILGGAPVFSGTRVPIVVLFENIADGFTVQESVDAYPTLTLDVALEALRQAAILLIQHGRVR